MKEKEEIALFRYSLVRPLVEKGLEKEEVSRRLSEACSKTHIFPDGSYRKLSKTTLRRWIKSYQTGGFNGLFPLTRSDKNKVRIVSSEIVDLAVALKKEAPKRSSKTIADIIEKTRRVLVSERTVRRHLAINGATTKEITGNRKAFGRFEKDAPNDLWIGDALHGPKVIVNGKLKKAHLFAFIDDYSRLIPHGEFFADETLPRLERTLRVAIEKRGLPNAIYVDRGAVFISKQFDGICARLGIKRILASPGEPAGRGKIERFFRSLRGQFLTEVEVSGINDIEKLNEAFIAFLEVSYHRRVHSETLATPIDRFLDKIRKPDPATLADAFAWYGERLVNKCAQVSLEGNKYDVDPLLVGRKVTLKFDPFDLSKIEVFYNQASFGFALPFVLKRHCHKTVKEETKKEVEPTGINYLSMMVAEHESAMRKLIPYRKLNGGDIK
jgi:putative transposase